MNCLLENLSAENCPNELLNEINSKAVLYAGKCRRQFENRAVRKCCLYLKENDLLAVPFDKGAGFCVMRRSTYFKKCSQIFDSQEFNKVEAPSRSNAKELVIKEEERVNGILMDLFKNKEISESIYRASRSTGGQIPRMYGLAKLH